MLRLLLTATLLLLLGPLAAGQVPEQDPRYGPDPRDSVDPRIGEDPRTGDDPRGAPADPYGVLEGDELFETLYTAGETGRLKIAMRENAWSLLPFIDSYCGKWLVQADRPEPLAEADAQLMKETADKGLELAQMADASIGDTRFGAYVTAVFGWTEQQRAEFKQEQESFELGMKIWRSAETPEQARSALTPLNQALDHARLLGDMWAEASAYTMIGRVQVDSGQTAEGRSNAGHAIRIGRQIRDMDSVWDGLTISYEAAVSMQSWDAAREALKDQYLISIEVDDEESAQKILDVLVDFDLYMEAAVYR